MLRNAFGFLLTASPAERRALAASTLGWMLDGMDVTLYAMAVPALLREFHLSTSQAGLLASVTLIASAVGGILFGFLADRAGRRLALMLSIAVYSRLLRRAGCREASWSSRSFGSCSDWAWEASGQRERHWWLRPGAPSTAPKPWG